MLPTQKERWTKGETAYFEYHCWESIQSQDADLWLRSHQRVTVLGEDRHEDWPGSFDDRMEAGCPIYYRIRFHDGAEYSATEDELFTNPSGFYRPDPPQSLTTNL